MQVPATDRKDSLESLEALLVFFVPLVLIIPFYVSGFLPESLVNCILYAVYITCSIMLTKFNGRPLAEIGLARKGLTPSLVNSIALVLAAFITRFIVTDLKISPYAGSLETVAFNMFFWSLSGFGQEILFRGLILFSLNRWKGWKVALFVSTVLFGLIHVQRYQSPSGIILVSVAGAAWGWIALKTKNIVGTSIAHSLFNFIFAFVFVS